MLSVEVDGLKVEYTTTKTLSLDYTNIGVLYMCFIAKNKLGAIRYLRTCYDLGLNEAKEIVESVWNDMYLVDE